VINPICQLYLDLLSTQLWLSWELGQLERLLESSQQYTFEKLSEINMKMLANQLGMMNVIDVEEFRRLLTEKCKLWANKYFYEFCGSCCSWSK